MKNREKLMKMALIDMLYLANGRECSVGDMCVVRRLSESQTQIECPTNINCYNCISMWLNKNVNH